MGWFVSDINQNEHYVLHLCQTECGLRHFRLVAIGTDAFRHPPSDVFLVTAPVPHNLLRNRNVIAISVAITLDDGTPFTVDAHGTWLTASESNQMDSGREFAEIEWRTGRAPRFAPY